MHEIKIIIENLKKIDKLEFILKLEKGIYAIVGNNGVGKSSLITCVAKLVKPSILKEEFSGSTNNFSKATITYIDPYGREAIWKKNPNWQARETSNCMPRYKGFFESSILTGTRFFHLDNKNLTLKHKDIENSKEATAFIKTTMDYIINGCETSFFDKLCYAEFPHRKRLYYIDLGDGNHITEFNFSTGEYFLLSVLKIIQTFSKRKHQDELRLLIIDEIDIALHPLAQRRFIEKLLQWMDEFNLLIVFATHSLPILESLNECDIYHIENDKIFNPIYPAYLASKLHQHTYYDKIILVEDRLASKFIEKIIEEISIERILYKIIPIGGWEKVLEIHTQNKKYKYFSHASTLCILDGDVRDKANKGKNKNIEKRFLPFSNVERVCVESIFEEKFLTIEVNKLIYPKKVLELKIEEFKESNIEISKLNTSQVKNIFKKLINEIVKHSEKEEIEIKNIFIKAVYNNFDHKVLSNDIKHFFGIEN